MSETDFPVERALFEKCLEYAPADWERVLEENSDNASLRGRVLRMLEHHRDTQSGSGGFLRLDSSDPERIGPYRILQRLGEGGMGIVYAAEQREPVRRRVAVKVLKSPQASREVLARFDVERQALSLMTHPNIAHILDAGTTVDQRPYIVMEFVAGEPITHYCEKRALPLAKRLELFVTVCEAVQHAHQKGVIHRDLKPSNILVMEEDGRAVPKVIDFGIAKAVTQRLTDHTLETRVGSLLGTPDYMSPEQAELTPLDVDTRSDVYALGAVLYQLLAGVPPLELTGAGMTFSDMQRVIREEEPRPPSTRADASVARQVRGELDWITCKALEKQRHRRYATAAEFGADIVRHLSGEATLAGPHSLRYLAGKFVRRHAVAVGVTSAAFILLGSFALLMTWQVQQTALERDRANREAQKAREVTAFLVQTFSLANPGEGQGADVTARKLLDVGLESVQQELAGQPEVRAALLQTLSNAYSGLGEYEQGEKLARDALQLSRETFGTQSAEAIEAAGHLGAVLELRGNFEESLQTLQSALDGAAVVLDKQDERRSVIHNELGEVLLDLNRVDEAEGEYDRANTLESAAGRREGPTRARAVSGLANVALARGDMQAAESQLREASRLMEKIRGPLHVDVRIQRIYLANVLRVQGKLEEAEKIVREELERVVETFGEDHADVGAVLNNLALVVMDSKRYEEAAELYSRSLALTTKGKGERHPDTLRILHNRALAWLNAGDAERAIADAREVLGLQRAVYGNEHPEVATTVNTLASALRAAGRFDQALPVAREAVGLFETVVGAAHWKTANARRNLGWVLLELGEFESAEAELVRARTDLAASLGETHARVRRADEGLITLYERTGREAAADDLRRATGGAQ